MVAELKPMMCAAAGVASIPVGAPAGLVWGISLSEILKVVMDKAIELGRIYRNDIESAAHSAIDALVELDIPGVPDVLEGAIDSATRAAGYQAVTAILDALLGVQAE